MRPWAIVGCGVLVACSATTGDVAACPASRFRSSPPLVMAHAGGEGLGPGNTIETMRLAMAAGADGLEVDLWMTRDGVIVARHDRDLSTSTDGDGPVDEATWADLQQLTVNGGGRVASLEEILAEFPEVLTSLEIKQVEPSMAATLCEVLDRTGSMDRVYVSSNEDEAVYAAQDACPEVQITTTYRDLADRQAAEASGARWCSAAPIGQPPYRAGRFTAASVAAIHASGAAIFTWTVDDPAVLLELAEVGVDAVYTRRPDVARKVFDQFAAGDG
jgi:glycerophosphoryl diester phosphodiesterase